MPKISVNQVNSKLMIELSIGGNNIGQAIVQSSNDLLRLDWIEIMEKHQRKGYASKILEHIIENLLKEDQDFLINVTDEQTIPFYLRFFEKMKIESDIILNWIQDEEHHPEIHIAKGTLQELTSNKIKFTR